MGDRVSQGQIVATLESTDLRHELAMAQAQLARDDADIERAVLERKQAEERRKRAVNAAEHLNIDELSSARYTARFAITNEKAIRARRVQNLAKEEQLRERLAQRSLRAPVDSVVSDRFLDPGATVGVGRDRITAHRGIDRGNVVRSRGRIARARSTDAERPFDRGGDHWPRHAPR